MTEKSSNRQEISPGMTVLEVVSNHRETESVFKRYDEQFGVCICCNYLFETLSEVAQKVDMDLENLIQDLEDVIWKNA